VRYLKALSMTDITQRLWYIRGWIPIIGEWY